MQKKCKRLTQILTTVAFLSCTPFIGGWTPHKGPIPKLELITVDYHKEFDKKHGEVSQALVELQKEARSNNIILQKYEIKVPLCQMKTKVQEAKWQEAIETSLSSRRVFFDEQAQKAKTQQEQLENYLRAERAQLEILKYRQGNSYQFAELMHDISQRREKRNRLEQALTYAKQSLKHIGEHVERISIGKIDPDKVASQKNKLAALCWQTVGKIQLKLGNFKESTTAFMQSAYGYAFDKSITPESYTLLSQSERAKKEGHNYFVAYFANKAYFSKLGVNKDQKQFSYMFTPKKRTTLVSF